MGWMRARWWILIATPGRACGEPISRDQIAANPRVVGVECAIAFGGKESSNVDDPHDHSVANAMADQ
jgi:hypothetical protein